MAGNWSVRTTRASNRWSHGISWSCLAMPSALISAMTMDGSCRCVPMGWICPSIWTMGGRHWKHVCMTSSGWQLMELEISIFVDKGSNRVRKIVRGPASSRRWPACAGLALMGMTSRRGKSMLHAPEAVVFDQHNHAYISDTEEPSRAQSRIADRPHQHSRRQRRQRIRRQEHGWVRGCPVCGKGCGWWQIKHGDGLAAIEAVVNSPCRLSH